MQKHTGEMLFKCDFCKKAFGFKFSLEEHKIIRIKKKHMDIQAGEEPYQCNVCGKESSRQKLKSCRYCGNSAI